MRWIWHMCYVNMRQRGIRTWLTILGVVLGVISIVSLMGIGLGVKKELLHMTESEGGATQISIYGITEGKRKDRMLTDRRLQEVMDLEGVAAVYPVLTVNAEIMYKQYQGYWQIQGVPTEYLQAMNTLHDVYPSGTGQKPELIMGNQAVALLYNNTTGISYGEVYEGKTIDLSGETLELKLGDGDAEIETRMDIADMTKEDSYSIYCDINVLKLYLKRQAAGGSVIGQPVDSNGDSYQEWIYSEAIVEAEDIDAVDKLVKNLQDMGYQAESNKEFVDYMQKATKIAQMVLAGIGMIALVVAVIGIGNTMTTAVYDRVQDIGILKVLGSDPGELLYLFLLESGILGGMGGLIGVLVSYGITELLVNHLAVKLMNLPQGTTLAIIPWWLAVAAFIFAILLGIAAGFFPARWAARLKPIEAMGK